MDVKSAKITNNLMFIKVMQVLMVSKLCILFNPELQSMDTGSAIKKKLTDFLLELIGLKFVAVSEFEK